MPENSIRPVDVHTIHRAPTLYTFPRDAASRAASLQRVHQPMRPPVLTRHIKLREPRRHTRRGGFDPLRPRNRDTHPQRAERGAARVRTAPSIGGGKRVIPDVAAD